MRLNSFASTAAIVAAVAGLAAFSGIASAASSVGSGAASAALDFRVTIPSVVFLQVGTGTFKQNVGTVDTIVFAPSAAQFVGLQPVAGTGGNLAGGKVTVRVFGNVGQMTLSSTASALATIVEPGDTADTIAWSEITVAATNGDIPHGAFDADGVISELLDTNGNSRVTNLSDEWTYSYANTAEVADGVYAGTVTYTVTAP